MPSNDSGSVNSRDDGIRARRSGLYALDKLSFLREFMPPALLATTSKQQRWYVDLFAGPGRNAHVKTWREWEGSPLIALQAHAQSSRATHFTNAAFVNKNRKDFTALSDRIARLRASGRCLVPGTYVDQHRGDANELIPAIMQKIHPLSYALVVADITAPKQLPWQSVKRLKAGGHRSVDLYMLFPLSMGLNRMLPYSPGSIAPNEATLDSFFGSDGWRPIWEAQRPHSRDEMRRALLEFYMDRLRIHGPWKYVFEVRDVRRSGTVPLYRMLFATDSDVGARISNWLVDHYVDHTGQRSLFT
jgi:three-Cys-motif partner protein